MFIHLSVQVGSENTLYGRSCAQRAHFAKATPFSLLHFASEPCPKDGVDLPSRVFSDASTQYNNDCVHCVEAA